INKGSSPKIFVNFFGFFIKYDLKLIPQFLDNTEIGLDNGETAKIICKNNTFNSFKYFANSLGPKGGELLVFANYSLNF
ncbi:23719_t:CDS:1, partial [Gigaspora rosea]